MSTPDIPHRARSQKQDEEHSAKEVVRFNPVLSVIMLCGAALLGWTVSLIPSASAIQTTVGLCSGILSAIFLLVYANVKGTRAATVIKTTAWTFVVVSTLILIVMAMLCTTPHYYFIVSAFLLLIFLSVSYTVARSGQ